MSARLPTQVADVNSLERCSGESRNADNALKNLGELGALA